MNPALGRPIAPPLILAERERPFWGFGEIFIVAALFVPALAIGGGNLLLLASAAIATIIPDHRAASADPMRALRTE